MFSILILVVVIFLRKLWISTFWNAISLLWTPNSFGSVFFWNHHRWLLFGVMIGRIDPKYSSRKSCFSHLTFLKFNIFASIQKIHKEHSETLQNLNPLDRVKSIGLKKLQFLNLTIFNFVWIMGGVGGVSDPGKFVIF